MNTFAALAVTAFATLATTSIVHAETAGTDDENPLVTQTTTTTGTQMTTGTQTSAGTQTTAPTTTAPTTTATTATTATTKTTTKTSPLSMFSLGVSIGETGQQTGGLILYIAEYRTTVMETQLHVGYHADRVIETGLDLELGGSSILHSTAALAEVKAYLLPMLPVSPTLTAGAGVIDEYATGMSEQSTWRVAVVAGAGLEGRIGRWSVNADLRLMAVRSDGQPSILTTMDNEFTHDGIMAGSMRVGVSRRF